MNTIQTQCPTCRTVFDLSIDILKQAKGLVRCGACQQVFKAAIFVESAKNEIEKSEPSELKKQTEPPIPEVITDTNGSSLGLPLYQLGEASIYKPASKPLPLQNQSSIDAFGNLKPQPELQAEPTDIPIDQTFNLSKETKSIQIELMPIEPVPLKSNLSLKKAIKEPDQSERAAFGLPTDLTKIPVQTKKSIEPEILSAMKVEILTDSSSMGTHSKGLPKKPRISLLNLFLTFILLILLLVFFLSLAMQFIPEFKASVLSDLPMLSVYWTQIQALIDFSALKNLFNL